MLPNSRHDHTWHLLTANIIWKSILKYKRNNSSEFEGILHFVKCLISCIFTVSGSFKLTQCHAICRYLGEEFGLSPDTKEEKALAEQLSITCHDYIAEGLC